MYPFEHWHEGRIHFHWENWNKYVKELNHEYPHNWDHRRYQIFLAHPRLTVMEHLDPGTDGVEEEVIAHIDRSWSVVFQPFPAHIHDPIESWACFIEDKHASPTYGEPVRLIETGTTTPDKGLTGNGTFSIAFFKGQYWKITHLSGGGLGVVPPPALAKKMVSKWRSIDD